MSKEELIVVAGLGEVGRPLFNILSRRFSCVGVDVEPVEITDPCSVLHICYPFQIENFVDTTVGYIHKYRPALTIINSTVAPGTTRKVYEASGQVALAYSPVRGKHKKMEEDLLRYKKFVAGCTAESTMQSLRHFADAGFKTDSFQTPEVAELSKLMETTCFGMLIAWAQEVERFAVQHDSSFDEVNAFIKEIDFLPSHIFPGHIGGHCVMPNIAILRAQFKSRFLDAIVESNQLKEQQLQMVAAGGAQ